MKAVEKNIEEILKRRLPIPPPEVAQEDCNRVWLRLQLRVADEPRQQSSADIEPMRVMRWRQAVVVFTAATLLLAAFVGVITVWRRGSTDPVIAGHSQTVAVHDKLAAGATARTYGMPGAVFSLPDGSTIEMRADSELSLERADDGLRIRLTNGDVIVNAAKQPAGRHLYVQTKDVTVSVVGTVFLVKAEARGSRVAVIEGAVQVRQGATEKTLHPGDQIRSNASMDVKPMVRELEWSRNAPEHMALLQQTSSLTAARGEEARAAFDVVSIRPGVPQPPPSGGRGGPPTASACGGPFQSGSPLKLDPRHLFADNATAFRLITLAYGRNCRTANVSNLLNGPEWIKTEQFDIQALVPQGTPSYSEKQLNDGKAPELQSMLQTMLVQRFNLAMHRETRDIPVFNLVIAKPGKVKLSGDQSPAAPIDLSNITSGLRGNGPALKGSTASSQQPPRGLWFFHIDPAAGTVVIAATAIPLSEFLNTFVQGEQGRLILDKTGLDGLIDIPLQVLDVGPFDAGGASIYPEILSQLGLKLEAARGPAEFLVIDRIERPSAN